MHNDCAIVEALIPQYDSLSDSDRQIVEKHVASCKACREEFELIEFFGQLLMAEAGETMPPDMTERVMGAITRSPAPEPSNRPIVMLGILVAAQLILLSVQRVPLTTVGVGLQSLWAGLAEIARDATVPLSMSAEQVEGAIQNALDAIAVQPPLDYLWGTLVAAAVLATVVLSRSPWEKGANHA